MSQVTRNPLAHEPFANTEASAPPVSRLAQSDPDAHDGIRSTTNAKEYTSPGYPLADPCLSFWLQHTRTSSLLGHRTTPDLPSAAEVVIIGAGMSGAATAYYLLTGPNPPKSVLLLEAREACHGATGRNGGHCRPDRYLGYRAYKKHFGREQALKILENEKDTLALMTEVVAKEKIDCEFELCDTFDVALSDEFADELLQLYQEYKSDGGQTEAIVEFITDAELAKKRTRIAAAKVASVQPAATFWPYKFVEHILSLCIREHGLELQTSTKVTSVSQADSSTEGKESSWIVHTDRGDIAAQKVVYTTNAYTATLLPEFLGYIVPFRGQCAAIVPPPAYSGPKAIRSSMSLNDHDYFFQRPKDGIIIAGGGWRYSDCTDDTTKSAGMTKHLKTMMKSYLADWDTEALGEGLLTDWTGIMGYTPEFVPFVGKLEGKPNAFINAGHAGHGMSRVMTASRGIAAIIRGDSWATTGLPECFQPTRERLSGHKIGLGFTRSELLDRQRVDGIAG
ncbi:hypothetical protein HGRIS_002704 [Hohenbuehelia grisea]|uniref:FAD dependent oxidoreductase domain-containing protein n=1 Tax=Hohenbuehelia grisea TaxID=104357 RepID=A0ABR3JMI8_9AGAR